MSDLIIKELAVKGTNASGNITATMYDVGADAKNVFYTQKNNSQVNLQDKIKLFDDCLHINNQTGQATGHYSHVEGNKNSARGWAAHAEGWSSNNAFDYIDIANDSTVSLEEIQSKWSKNKFSVAYGNGSHCEGHDTIAYGTESHAEGTATQATGGASHSEGYNTQAKNSYSHAEGNGTVASGLSAHAEGNYTTASSQSSHAEGKDTVASGSESHAEGQGAQATGIISHAEGHNTVASGIASHAEGKDTQATGDYSHAEGNGTIAAGRYSHAEGCGTIASTDYQHVQGKYNIEDGDRQYAHIVGGGEDLIETGQKLRKNIYTLDWNGNANFLGDISFKYKDHERLSLILDDLQAQINNLKTQIATLQS